MTSIFGPIFDGGRLDHGVANILERWMPTYLVEAERQTGRPAGRLKPPGKPVIVGALDEPLLQQPPAVLVVSAGLDGQPERHAEDVYTAAWAAGVGVIISDNQPGAVRDLARLYIAAIRAVLLQKPDLGLGDTVLGVEWLDESYDRGPSDAARSLAVGYAAFRIHVQGVGEGASSGPAEPIPTPDPAAPDAPVVQTVDIDLIPTSEFV